MKYVTVYWNYLSNIDNIVYYILAKVFWYSKLQLENMLGGNSEVETFQLSLKTGRNDIPEPEIKNQSIKNLTIHQSFNNFRDLYPVDSKHIERIKTIRLI